MKPQEHLARSAIWVIKYRRWVLAAVIATSLTLGAGLRQVTVEVDPDQQLPQAHPYIQALNRTHNLFGDKNLVMIGLRPRDGNAFSIPFLKTVRSISHRLRNLPGVNPQLLRGLGSTSSTLVERDREELRVRPALPDDIVDTDTESLRERLMSHPLYHGVLVSNDGTALALYCTIELTPTLPGYVNIHRAIRDILESEDNGTFTFHLSGPVVIASQLNAEASKVPRYLLVSLLVIGLVHYHAFRNWQAVLLPILTGLLAVTWAMGLMGHLSIPLDPFNATTPILIMAIGAGHAVQLLKRYHEERQAGFTNDDAIVRSIRTAGGAMIASGAIAIVSFLSLSLLGTRSMRTFGLLTAFGISSALLIELTLIPAMRSMLTAGDLPPSTLRLPRLLARISLVTTDRRRATLILMFYAGLIIISAYSAHRVEVDTSFKRNLSAGDAVRRDDDFLNQEFAGTNDLLILIDAPASASLIDPGAIGGIDRLQRRLEELPGVGKTLSFVDTLRVVHAAIRDSSDSSALPSSRSLAAQYLFLYSLSGGDDLGTMLTPDYLVGKITLLLHPDSTRYGEGIILKAREIAQEELPSGFKLSVAGTLASNAALTEVMVRGKLLNILQVVCITALVSSVMFQSVLLGFLVVIPVVASLLLNFGLMGAFGIPMDVGSSVVSALSVGIGADYAVYFLARLQEESRHEITHADAIERATQTSGTAVVYVATAIALGYLILCTSSFRLFVQLGAMVAVAMLTAASSTLIILPSLLTVISTALRTNRANSSSTDATDARARA